MRPKRRTDAGGGPGGRLTTRLLPLLGFSRAKAMPVGTGDKWALRSRMPTRERVGESRRDEGDNRKLKVTSSRRLRDCRLTWIVSPSSTHFHFPALNVFGNDCVFTYFSFKSLSPPKSKSPTCLAHHYILDTAHSAHRHGVSHVSEQPERFWEQLCFFLAPFIRCFLFMLLIVLT